MSCYDFDSEFSNFALETLTFIKKYSEKNRVECDVKIFAWI